MTTVEMLEKILNDLKNIGGIEASAVASRDGLLIYSTVSGKLHAETFAAMSATMLGAAETATAELGKGIPERIIVESKDGKIITMGAGSKALLVVMTEPDAGLGLILIELAKASEKIKQVLG
ncbi:MAG: roadblock/LC7 domain-containing protein [Candidatus Methanoperedens sp.]|nr:roadblock/LC7 domain-containing protein [Candidatus Methanoperedens sp.]MCZ7361207.1 roadblock/LC7 domain-containing protein [Candidatus Methanoperedens sp.]HLB71629.1 roadblock/LC7 domain-containing protein [Candidatus Methanoperedens sp.]